MFVAGDNDTDTDTDTDTDDGLYDNYVETTVESGNVPLFLALFICVCTLCAIPLIVACVRKRCRSEDEADKEAEHVSSTVQIDEEDAGNDTRSNDAPASICRGTFAAEQLHQVSFEPLEPNPLEPNPLDAGIRRKRRGGG